MEKISDNESKEEQVIELYDKDGNRIIDLVDIILDESNKDLIMLEDNAGNVHKFERLAVVPFENEKYAILKNFISEDTKEKNEIILIFKIVENFENRGIFIVEDEKTALSILEEYNKNLKV